MKKWYCYSRAIEAAPATTSGPSSRETTASGGQTTSGPSSTSTTASGGQTTSGPSSRVTTAYDGEEVVTSSNGNSVIVDGNGAIKEGNNIITGRAIIGGVVSDWILPNEQRILLTTFEGSHNHGGAAQSHNHGNPENLNIAPAIDSDGLHQHSTVIPPHTHDMHAHSHFIDHEHKVEVPPHAHGMDHTHQIGPHTHGMDHTHQIGPHTHGMDHTHTIPAHDHEIQYGIFQGPTPTSITVRVDGIVIPGLGINATDVDIIPYLTKDGSGRVERGWHTVEISPNDLGRIVASVNTQIFVQSRGGGNY